MAYPKYIIDTEISKSIFNFAYERLRKFGAIFTSDLEEHFPCLNFDFIYEKTSRSIWWNINDFEDCFSKAFEVRPPSQKRKIPNQVSQIIFENVDKIFKERGVLTSDDLIKIKFGGPKLFEGMFKNAIWTEYKYFAEWFIDNFEVIICEDWTFIMAVMFIDAKKEGRF